MGRAARNTLFPKHSEELEGITKVCVWGWGWAGTTKAWIVVHSWERSVSLPSGEVERTDASIKEYMVQGRLASSY